MHDGDEDDNTTDSGDETEEMEDGFELEYIRTNKGPRHFYLACGGYLYTRNNTYYPTDGGPESVTWECIQRKHNSTRDGDIPPCRFRLVIKGDTIRFSKKHPEHTHAADDADIDVARAKGQLLTAAETGHHRTARVVSRSLVGLSPVAHMRMPNLSSLSRTVRRKRAIHVNHPDNPVRVADIPYPIPRQYKRMENGSKWCQWDSRDANRTLMFATEEALDLLEDTSHWFLDGTFKVAPLAYRQLYTVHALVGTMNIPCAYVLMREMTLESYELVFAKLKLLRRMRPRTILLDFEGAAMGALRNEFPGVTLKGCFFHLSQSVWRHIQRNRGAKRAYKGNPQFAITCRMIPALAFLPPGRIVKGMEFVSAYAIHKNHDRLLADTLRYFALFYTGTNLTEPRYERNFWSVADRVSDALPRTNNALEGWHRGLASHFGCHHPPLWTFIEGLREQSHKQHMRITRALNGDTPHTKRGVMWVTTRISNLWRRYRLHFEDRNVRLHGPTTVRFLKAIANLFRML